MRTRVAMFLALVLGVPCLISAAAPAVAAERTVLAQSPEAEESPADGSTQDSSKDTSTETGATEEQATPAEEEVGPVWTYQMSKIVIALLLLIGLAIGGAYFNFVVKRQREGV